MTNGAFGGSRPALGFGGPSASSRGASVLQAGSAGGGYSRILAVHPGPRPMGTVAAQHCSGFSNAGNTCFLNATLQVSRSVCAPLVAGTGAAGAHVNPPSLSVTILRCCTLVRFLCRQPFLAQCLQHSKDFLAWLADHVKACRSVVRVASVRGAFWRPGGCLLGSATIGDHWLGSPVLRRCSRTTLPLPGLTY